jgi:hypothetical protein
VTSPITVRRGRRIRAKRELRRQPSLFAGMLGLTSPRQFVGEFTGLQVRPVLTVRKKQKRGGSNMPKRRRKRKKKR